MVEVKFCGLTRAADARAAVAAGASYVGVVFAGGPRAQTPESAAGIMAEVPKTVGRVGVFSPGNPSEIARQAESLGLSVVQLHGDPSAGDVEALRTVWPGAVWAALRVSETELPVHAGELFATADGVLLEPRVDGALGGTGVALAWQGVAAAVAAVRAGGRARLVLAGGLRPDNVADAVRTLRPDVVDVSSGIEARLGIKDPGRMRAFSEAVRSVEVER